MGYENFKFEKEIKLTLNYTVYTPKSYSDGERWPLILSLHGSGECGNDIDKVKVYGIHRILNEDDDLPFVVVSPQCPTDEIWEMQFNYLNILLDKIIREYQIDHERIYLTGYSMGGYGAWNYAIMNPDKFAAVVPISGGAMSPKKAIRLKNIPIWVAHGDCDTSVNFEESKRIVDGLKEYNPNLIFKIYKGAGHEVCTIAYEEKELFEWLLKQKKDK